MYKSFLLTALCVTGIFSQAQAQLIALPNGNVGIGVNPAAQLHTTGSVLFQGMAGTGNRLLQTSATGALSPITGGTAGQVLTQGATGLSWMTPATANFWNLTGNTGNAANHFFGTTDDKPILVKTNSIEQFRVRTQAYSTFLMSNDAIPTGVLDNYPVQNLPYLGLSMDIQRKPITYGSSIGLMAKTAATNGTTISGTATGSAAYLDCWSAGGTVIGVFGMANISKIAQSTRAPHSGGGSFALSLDSASMSSPIENLVGGVVTRLEGSIKTSQNMILASMIADDKINSNLTWAAYMRGRAYISGNLGVGTNAPTAQLHTVGTVRHQGLGTGTGRILVADANGNVFLSNIQTFSREQAEAMTTQIKEQTSEIADLKARLERLEKLLSASNGAAITPNPTNEKVVLEQNRPNPANDLTVIGYELPENYSKMVLNVTDLNGKIIFTQTLTAFKGDIEINTGSWAEGTYLYSLAADGKILKTKKLVVVKN
jgi:hypothetical protein